MTMKSCGREVCQRDIRERERKTFAKRGIGGGSKAVDEIQWWRISVRRRRARFVALWSKVNARSMTREEKTRQRRQWPPRLLRRFGAKSKNVFLTLSLDLPLAPQTPRGRWHSPHMLSLSLSVLFFSFSFSLLLFYSFIFSLIFAFSFFVFLFISHTHSFSPSFFPPLPLSLSFSLLSLLFISFLPTPFHSRSFLLSFFPASAQWSTPPPPPPIHSPHCLRIWHTTMNCYFFFFFFQFFVLPTYDFGAPSKDVLIGEHFAVTILREREREFDIASNKFNFREISCFFGWRDIRLFFLFGRRMQKFLTKSLSSFFREICKNLPFPWLPYPSMISFPSGLLKPHSWMNYLVFSSTCGPRALFRRPFASTFSAMHFKAPREKERER